MSFATAGSFTDHPRKILFRRNWAKPILEHLSNKLGKKLIYLGLPGIRALDVLEWQEFLRIVIAFQAENYDGRSNDQTAEAELNELINILNDLETKRVIETYALYTGYMEQVVMSEEDDYNEPFIINDYITVYNLDFCNPLSSPYPVIGKDRRTFKCYKIDVIQKLLSIERAKYTHGADGCFVMFLTVNSDFIERIVSSINDPIIKQYIASNLKGVTGNSRLLRLLKAYAFHKLSQVFTQYGFNIEFLPPIYYQGSGTYFHLKRGVDLPYMMSTFTILGSPKQLSAAGATYSQDFKTYLENKFIWLSDKGMSCYTDSKGKIIEKDFNPEISEILSSSHTVTTLWP